MTSFSDVLPWLITMSVLIGMSAFFSASEAALFILRPADRRELQNGSTTEKLAARLLAEPERLLTAVLFWNLVVNIIYFTLSSVVALQLENSPRFNQWWTVGFALLSLLAIIFFSEMLPKSLAVTQALAISRWVSLPLSIAVRLVDPVLPTFRGVTLVSRRLFCPAFRAEPDMELKDLERAIQLSGQDQDLIQQEQTVLRNIVHLSEIRVDEWMRPRSQFRVIKPPVSPGDLQDELSSGGYLLIGEPGTEEVDKALRLSRITTLEPASVNELAKQVVYLPWRATVADAMQLMTDAACDVTAIVNEFGDTVGVLTVDDILETVFTFAPSRSKRILDLNPVHRISENCWVVAGMMSLNGLARHFEVELPASRSVTIAGVIQQSAGRVVQPGDECPFGPFRLRVIEAPHQDNVLVELMFQHPPGEELQ